MEEQGEVEEEAEQICPICYDAMDDSKSCHFACCILLEIINGVEVQYFDASSDP